MTQSGGGGGGMVEQINQKEKNKPYKNWGADMVHINILAGTLQVVPLLSLGKDICLNFVFYTGA